MGLAAIAQKPTLSRYSRALCGRGHRLWRELDPSRIRFARWGGRNHRTPQGGPVFRSGRFLHSRYWRTRYEGVFIRDQAIAEIQVNEACSSGCGSFIETFARTLGYSIQEFAASACESKIPFDLGTRCTVFMNSRVKQAYRSERAFPTFLLDWPIRSLKCPVQGT